MYIVEEGEVSIVMRPDVRRCDLKIVLFTFSIISLSTLGTSAQFQARVGKHFFGENSARSAEIFCSLSTLVFSLPTLDLITWVGKDPPAIT